MLSALSLSRYPWTLSIQCTVFGYIHFQGWLLLIIDYCWLSHISQMFSGSICDGWRFHQVDLGMSNTRSSTLRFVMETLIFMTSSFSPFKHINEISPIQTQQYHICWAQCCFVSCQNCLILLELLDFFNYATVAQIPVVQIKTFLLVIVPLGLWYPANTYMFL